jgi:SprT protein
MPQQAYRIALARLTPEIKQRVESRLAVLLGHAQAAFDQRYPVPRVDYDLRGTTAGRADPRRFRIRLNPVLLIENPTDFVHQTLAHEFAHLIAHRVYGACIRPHGSEWQAVMRLFGVTPDRCHTFDVANAQVRRQQEYLYRCGCREHHISAVRHRRLQRGQADYRCRVCREPIRPVEML